MFEYGLDFAVYVLTGYLAFRYLEKLLENKFSRRCYAMAGFMAVYAVCQLGVGWILSADNSGQGGIYNGILQTISGGAVLLLLQKYLFQADWPRQVFALASFIAGWAVLRFAVSPFSYVLFDYWSCLWNGVVEYSMAKGLVGAEDLLAVMGIVNQGVLISVLLFCRLLQLGLLAVYLWLIQRYFCSRAYELSWAESWFLLIPCVTVLCIDITLRVMIYSVDNSALLLIYTRAPATLFLLPLVSLLLLGMVVAAVVLFRGLVQFKAAESKRLLLENGIYDIQRQVEEMQDIYGDMRGLRHDLRGHIASLTAYVHNHLQDRQPELEHYLTQMTKTTERLDFADKTGHPITDIILHQTRQQAKRQGTEFTAAFHYPADREFDIYDISVILNNGLKNALEACAKIPPPAGIEVRSYSKGSLFFIEIENDFAGELVFSENDGLPCTTKRDKERHGIGLANITRCAEKYQGSVEAAVVQKENRQRFCLTVMLYH